VLKYRDGYASVKTLVDKRKVMSIRNAVNVLPESDIGVDHVSFDFTVAGSNHKNTCVR